MKESDYAIKWIDKLQKTRMKQGMNRLGSSKLGYCCLGIGCQMFGVDFRDKQSISHAFKEKVGLLVVNGTTKNEKGLYVRNKKGKMIMSNSLAGLNDKEVSFNAISKLLKARPSLFFEYDIAEEINEHYKI